MSLRRKVLPLLLALLVLLSGVLSSLIQWKQDEKKVRENSLNDLISVIDAEFESAQAMAAIAGSYIGKTCTDEVVRSLSRMNASVEYIRSVNIIENGEWSCSSLEGRQSLGINSEGTKTRTLMTQYVNRQGTEMYMTYFPVKEQVVAVAIYKAAIDKILYDFSRDEDIEAQFLLEPKSNPLMQAGSSNFPFWIVFNTQESWVDYLKDNRYIIAIFVALAAGLFFHLKNLQKRSPMKELKSAINDDQFVPYYQPVVELSSGEIVGAEALIRWVHPEQGIIPPNEFINAAEQSGQINKMTLGLMKHIEKDMQALSNVVCKSFHIGLNVPPGAFSDDGFTKNCIEFITRMNQKSIRVMLEITERQQNVVSEDVRDRLKNAGADLALDDFGTGFSNYEALQKIAPKFLKIDKMFIDTLTHGGVSEHIVDNIIHLSKSTGIPLIAEGIEDSEQAVKLISKGVTLGQGYLYSKPIPYQDFRRLL
ncbi:EAL domain-containing protein [Pseudocitrobacter faecalis]|uniref:cyclic-guanylate-specific phosphodiesterase n=1 Tax=Pseudocitrobacter faecalis TaxID=1398493 RepID=A0ABX9FYU0_9ENTR|nr:EAL domain-containing protein (putative c-di-GMP-specific phosphodiesterase class I) [Pseudocitrobacter faecalis]